MGLNYDKRTLKISPPNVDNLENYESREIPIHTIYKNNIDVARIKETHNENTTSETFGYYNSIWKLWGIFLQNTTTYSAGVAIEVRNNILNNVNTINRINGRIMQIAISTDKHLRIIAIAITYAPHHGYNDDEIKNIGLK